MAISVISHLGFSLSWFQVQASRVKYIDDAIADDPNDHDHIIEREFVDEICEAHAKPGEAAYNSSHDMDLSGDQEWMHVLIFNYFFLLKYLSVVHCFVFQNQHDGNEFL